jgi:hypothetical protein
MVHVEQLQGSNPDVSPRRTQYSGQRLRLNSLCGDLCFGGKKLFVLTEYNYVIISRLVLLQHLADDGGDSGCRQQGNGEFH